eukprot:PhF_6_TR31803/c0_g1_i1/m.46906
MKSCTKTHLTFVASQVNPSPGLTSKHSSNTSSKVMVKKTTNRALQGQTWKWRRLRMKTLALFAAEQRYQRKNPKYPLNSVETTCSTNLQNMKKLLTLMRCRMTRYRPQTEEEKVLRIHCKGRVSLRPSCWDQQQLESTTSCPRLWKAKVLTMLMKLICKRVS